MIFESSFRAYLALPLAEPAPGAAPAGYLTLIAGLELELRRAAYDEGAATRCEGAADLELDRLRLTPLPERRAWANRRGCALSPTQIDRRAEP